MAKVDHRLGSKREATPKTPWSEVRKRVDRGAVDLFRRFETLRRR